MSFRILKCQRQDFTNTQLLNGKWEKRFWIRCPHSGSRYHTIDWISWCAQYQDTNYFYNGPYLGFFFFFAILLINDRWLGNCSWLESVHNWQLLFRFCLISSMVFSAVFGFNNCICILQCLKKLSGFYILSALEYYVHRYAAQNRSNYRIWN